MKFLFDFFPVILFFIAYKIHGIFVATAIAIAATIAQIAWVWLRHRKVDVMLWLSGGVIVLFGGTTLLLHDETFIKWKPTVLYWLLGVGLLTANVVFRKNPVKNMLGQQMVLPEAVWRRLLLGWIGFFLVMGALNLYVAFSFPTDTWVNFKLFGGMGLMILFVLLQALLLSKYLDAGERK
jgi:intracellular septation protein